MSERTIAIAGAGLLGRLLAWRLQRAGHQVFLCDKNPAHSQAAAAFTAAGMVSPLSELAVSERMVYDLGLRSMALWPQWLAQLEAPDLYMKQGSLIVAHPQDRTELVQFEQDIAHRLDDATNQIQRLNQSHIAELEPQLAHFSEGLFLPEEAHMDNRQLLVRLIDAFEHNGGRCFWQCELTFDNGRPTPAKLSELAQQGLNSSIDLWIDVRGVGAKQCQPEVRGVRGEVLAVRTQEVKLSRPVRLMHPRYQLYIVPKAGHHFVIGATQIESEDLSPISVQSTLELASALYTIHPAFAEARVVESPCNLRPSLPDNLPKACLEGNYLWANGLFRHGYLLAPAVCEQIEQLLQSPALPNQWQTDFSNTQATQ